jgi:O-antigen/teichoic acid export membrane protein
VFMLNHGDDILVGKLLGTTALGYYQLGFRLARMPVTEINFTLAKVLFPAFSRIREDLDRFRSAYFRSLTVIVMITLPVSFGIFSLAPHAIPVFLGYEWEDSVPLVQMFSILGLLVSIGSTTTSVFQALGTPWVTTYAQFVRAIIMFSLMLPLMRAFGVMGAAAAVVVSEVAISGFLFVRAIRAVEGSIRRVAHRLIGQLFSALGMTMGVYWAARLMTNPIQSTGVAVLVLLGVAMYGAQLFIVDRLFDLELLSTCGEVTRHIRGREASIAAATIEH